MSVPCGKCGYCLQNKRLDWAFRLEVEARYSCGADFVTLTYGEAALPFEISEGLARPTLVKSHLQKFVKDLRYRQGLCAFPFGSRSWCCSWTRFYLE